VVVILKKVLITGAGSGIGKEFAKLFLADGSRVLAVSLLDSELETLVAELDPTGTSLTTLQMDLAEPTAAASLMTWCDDNDWVPHTLINNAGFACYGDVVELDANRVAQMLALNIVTLTMTSTLFGRAMKSRGHGAILNVGSTAGMIPTPRIAAYGASKSYVNTFTYALAAATVGYARGSGARALEGYAMRTQPGREITWGELHVGAVQVFADAGFTEVSRPSVRRVVMRVDFDR